jgi:hypothetical protein
MGFDLYGMNPQENTKKPDILEKPWWEYETKKEKENHYIALNEYEKQNPGNYFRLNNWGWRPLWGFIYASCDDILTAKDFDNGHSNSGHRISKTKATRISKRLQKLDKLGILETYQNEVIDIIEKAEKKNKKLKLSVSDKEYDWAAHYPFRRDWVVEFANFCEQSGGFEIC